MNTNKKIIIGVLIGLVFFTISYKLYKNYLSQKKKVLKVAVKNAYENLLFATNKAVILPVSYPFLNELASALKDNPEYNVSIIGHTDNVGSEKSNQVLSEKRAEEVKNFLIKELVPIEKIMSKGMGESKPIDTNDTKVGQAKNRRVEFILSSPATNEVIDYISTKNIENLA
jgi:outer membrane protein OmpA-like peptidoglycan-associated protein